MADRSNLEQKAMEERREGGSGRRRERISPVDSDHCHPLPPSLPPSLLT